MMNPATANLLLNSGNFAACVGLPRGAVTKVYHTKESHDKDQKSTNKEADAAWRMMGIVGAAGAGGLYYAAKSGGSTEKKVNQMIAAQSAAATAMFVVHPFMKDQVKPEMRWLNAAGNVALGAYAMKKAME